ncbi:phosphoenolpyruvate carboxylase [Coralliovum pocilloporae]|uniref:phosphoenolpyruvate carboxylase n=1 Tax=Coralliovum pocilloporae TaxID=3066369 RepID=UPI0033074F7F
MAVVKAVEPMSTYPINEETLRTRLVDLRNKLADAPSINPISRLGFELSRDLEAHRVSIEELDQLAASLMNRAAQRRSENIRDRSGLEDRDTLLGRFADLVRASARDADGTERSFDDFAAHWSRASMGIVLTAHPTFGSSEAMRGRMMDQACGYGEDLNEMDLRHKPDAPITLDYEHREGQATLRHLRAAQSELIGIIFAVAEELYPDQWRGLRPVLSTDASWIGYDLDGRTDIHWLGSFHLRLKEKRVGLLDLRQRLADLRNGVGDDHQSGAALRNCLRRVDDAIDCVADQIAAVDGVAGDMSNLARIANDLTRNDPRKLVSKSDLEADLDILANTLPTGEGLRALLTVRGLIDTYGLGASHIHVRINAIQLHNAFRAFVDEDWARNLDDYAVPARVIELIRKTEVESVNFGSVQAETATAIRQFALIAQLVKHVDADTPIRFLIAECESPVTVLIALYFGRLFGVADHIDISPLFETPDGLDAGGRFLEQLLAQDVYRDYIEARGRMCIQTGFSDAGRFVGQITATLAIERIHLRLANALGKSGVQGVEAVIFSTHGESLGRGAHPGDLKSRSHYLMSAEVRRAFKRAGVPVKHETSFQGGDGFLFLSRKMLAMASMISLYEAGQDVSDAPDPFYEDRDIVLDFSSRLRRYQQDLFAHGGYRTVLGAFGANLLYRTGSRNVKRQRDYAHTGDRGDPAHMRAIPNNALLQQFGYVANVVAGVGAAFGHDNDRFLELSQTSPRLRSLLEMVAKAKRLSSLNAMGAYAALFDAGFWASRAYAGQEVEHNASFRALAEYLLDDERSSSINGLVHHLRLDAIDLHGILNNVGLDGGKEPNAYRLELDLLHAIRLALIMHVFLLAAKVPKFSTRNDFSYDQLLDRILSLDVDEAVQILCETFPHGRDGEEVVGYQEDASYEPRGVENYSRIHTELINPLERSFEMIREIGTGITHHFGAFG